jgi:hypothetical protein
MPRGKSQRSRELIRVSREILEEIQPATKGQAPRRCAVCSGPLTWPSVEFCSAACGEEWVARHREAERGSPESPPGPGDQARGRRRGRP